MKIRVVFGLLSLAFAGVANAQTCDKPICPLTIYATGTEGSCSLSIDKDTLDVAVGNTPVLVWKIDPTTYSFDDPGIVFDNNPPQFTPPINTKPYEIRVIDAHHSAGNFKYSVHVHGCKPLDPYIHNN